ncbi:MAG: orotidine-5'-phosphate decarboxylase [Firmicutes bacterium]|nr:orotidine-5'-phosphate decarboxylase [Bacillota bacterium]
MKITSRKLERVTIEVTRNSGEGFFVGRQAGDYNPIIVALDVPSWQQAQDLVVELSPVVDFFKIGMELFTAVGPKAIRAIKAEGCKVFLDLKYHDIPNTVKGAVGAATALGVDMMTIHASGGRTMLQAAVAGANESTKAPILLGVTVLTSIDTHVLQSELQVQAEVTDQVVHLGKLSIGSGLQGVVASPLEITNLRMALGDEAVIVTPGIRPPWDERGDQRRVATPQEAIVQGADYLVIGRPITAAKDPRAAAARIAAELKTGD